MGNEKIYQMEFIKVYQALVNKAERKGRSKVEVDIIIQWLTGYTQNEIDAMAESKITYADFFIQAPTMNENRKLIKGVVCGVRVETVEEPLMKEIRYLDKLVDELAKGKTLDQILRKP